MNNVTKKWIFLKASSVILIPLMTWFIINLVSIYDKEYEQVLNFFSTQPTKLLFSLLLIFAFFFSNLSISEVFEDYIQDEKTKNAIRGNYFITGDRASKDEDNYYWFQGRNDDFVSSLQKCRAP